MKEKRREAFIWWGLDCRTHCLLCIMHELSHNMHVNIVYS